VRVKSRLLAVPLTVLLLAGCAGDGPGGSVAATIPGAEDVATSDLARVLAEAEASGAFAEVPEGQQVEAQLAAQRQLLTQLVVLEVFEAAAADLDTGVTDADVDEAIDDLVAAAGGREAYEAELAQRGAGPVTQRLLVRSNLLRAALQEVLPADELEALFSGLVELDIQVDDRFGDWDPQTGVVPSADA
jgi:hypothetical protein